MQPAPCTMASACAAHPTSIHAIMLLVSQYQKLCSHSWTGLTGSCCGQSCCVRGRQGRPLDHIPSPVCSSSAGSGCSLYGHNISLAATRLPRHYCHSLHSSPAIVSYSRGFCGALRAHTSGAVTHLQQGPSRLAAAASCPLACWALLCRRYMAAQPKRACCQPLNPPPHTHGQTWLRTHSNSRARTGRRRRSPWHAGPCLLAATRPHTLTRHNPRLHAPSPQTPVWLHTTHRCRPVYQTVTAGLAVHGKGCA
jgi:hypothetical protein